MREDGEALHLQRCLWTRPSFQHTEGEHSEYTAALLANNLVSTTDPEKSSGSTRGAKEPSKEPGLTWEIST